MSLSPRERLHIHAIIENEGFDYGFRHKTSFKDEVKDPEFHRLLELYLKAAKELETYVGEPDD